MALAWLTAAVPVAGWIIAQTLTERIGHVSEFTSALVHQTSASTFAVILAVSAVVNAVIVTRRSPDTPRSYRWGRLGSWQLLLLLLTLAWLTCVVIGASGFAAEPFLGAGIAVASCGVFALAAQRDPDASARHAERVAARPPAVARRISAARRVIPWLVGAAIIVPIAVFALVPLHHSDCAVTGSGITSSGTESTHQVFTTCGDFVYDPATLPEDELRYSGVPLDITTQGFQVFPPALRLVSFEESE